MAGGKYATLACTHIHVYCLTMAAIKKKNFFFENKDIRFVFQT